MLERDQIIEIVVAVFSVLLMLGIMAYIGTTYTTDGSLTPEGGEILVGTIVGFILLLTAVGIGLAFVMNEPSEGPDGDDDTDSQNAY